MNRGFEQSSSCDGYIAPAMYEPRLSRDYEIKRSKIYVFARPKTRF